MRKFVIILLALLSISFSHAQSIFKIKKNHQIVATLVGSLHTPTSIPEQTQIIYKKNIEQSDIIYIEALYAKPNFITLFKKSIDSGQKSMKELIKIKHPTCLSQLSPRMKSSMEFSPLIFMFNNMIPTAKNGTPTTAEDLSMDEYIQFIALKAKIDTMEIESLQQFIETISEEVYEIDIFEAAENSCKKIMSDYQKNEVKFFDFKKAWGDFLTGNMDELRNDFIKSYIESGLPNSYIKGFVEKREDKFMEFIFSHINKKDHHLPMFVFGAAHLGGNGLLTRLKSAGYEIEKINYQ